MLANNAANMWVFRDGRSTVSGNNLRESLAEALRVLSPTSRDALVTTLLRAGELECALADAASPSVRVVAGITDALAAVLLRNSENDAALPALAGFLADLELPSTLNISTPEGFAYYALHPLDFADLAKKLPARSRTAAVIGIRSIGAPLSAIVAAALAKRGIRGSGRITVRPSGHPYDRRTQFSPDDLRWIAQCRARNAEFLVVDEGPGISGSSFLSVGDALLQAGVERQQVTFLCTREPDVESLAARDGALRWRGFRSVSVGLSRQIPADAKIYWGGGEWRRWLFPDTSQWPASWTQMERLKFLSADGRRLFKFAGLGDFGDAVVERMRRLADLGFGPRLLQCDSGFAEIDYVPGKAACTDDLNSSVLERIAAYCAIRASAFHARGAAQAELSSMVRFNLKQAFGTEWNGAVDCDRSRPVITDSRMQPFEWVFDSAGNLLKTDNATHGDDHFFPGPVDIAWDLAGAIIEWSMPPAARDYFLDCYRRRSGDDVRSRIPAYLICYAVFRMAYCAMGRFALRGSAEEHRLAAAYERYRRLARNFLRARHNGHLVPKGEEIIPEGSATAPAD